MWVLNFLILLLFNFVYVLNRGLGVQFFKSKNGSRIVVAFLCFSWKNQPSNVTKAWPRRTKCGLKSEPTLQFLIFGATVAARGALIKPSGGVLRLMAFPNPTPLGLTDARAAFEACVSPTAPWGTTHWETHLWPRTTHGTPNTLMICSLCFVALRS